MCEALLKIYEEVCADEIESKIKNGIERGLEAQRKKIFEQGVESGIKAFIEACMEFKATREEALTKLKEKFTLSDANAQEYLAKYWS